MGRTQKLAANIKEGVRNPQKIKKGLKNNLNFLKKKNNKKKKKKKRKIKNK